MTNDPDTTPSSLLNLLDGIEVTLSIQSRTFTHTFDSANGKVQVWDPQDDDTAADPEDPDSVLRLPIVHLDHQEVTIENTEMTRPPRPVPAGMATVRVPSPRSVSGIETLVAKWNQIADMSQELVFAQPTYPKGLRNRADHRDSAWVLYCLANAQTSYITTNFHDHTIPTGLTLDIGPPIDKGSPGNAGTERARDEVPVASRYLAAVTTLDAALPHLYQQGAGILKRLQRWMQDQGRRCYHGRIEGIPLYEYSDTELYEIENSNPRIGRYRSSGGAIGWLGRPTTGHSGEWTPDPMHGTVAQACTKAVHSRSRTSKRDVMEVIFAMMTQARGLADKDPRPARLYGRMTLCISQAILALGPYDDEARKRLLAWLQEMVTAWRAHAERARVLTRCDFAPPLMEKMAGDHMEPSPALVARLKKKHANVLTEADLELNEEELVDHNALAWTSVWMLGPPASGFRAAHEALALCASMGDDVTALANDVQESAEELAIFIAKYCVRSKEHDEEYLDDETGRTPAELAINPVVSVPDPDNPGETITVTKPIYPGAFYKTVAPMLGVCRVDEKSSARGVHTSFTAGGIEQLAMIVPEPLAKPLRAAVDRHIREMDGDWGSGRDDEHLAAGPLFATAVRGGLEIFKTASQATPIYPVGSSAGSYTPH